MFGIFNRKARAANVLAAYRAAISRGDYAAAVRRKLEFIRFGDRVRKHALGVVYADVLPSRRARFAMRGEPALVAPGEWTHRSLPPRTQCTPT